MRLCLMCSLLATLACGTPTPTPAPPAEKTSRAEAQAVAPVTPVKKQAPVGPDLVAMHAAEGSDPVRATEIWFMATLLAADPATHELGVNTLKALTVPYREAKDWTRLPSAATFADRLTTQPHIFRSYAIGTTPDNDYLVEFSTFKLHVAKSLEDPHGRGWAVFVQSSGADSPRPIYLKQIDGLWYPDVIANAYVGVRPPSGL